MPTIIQCLIDIVRFRLICNMNKSKEAAIKFSVRRYSPLLENLSKKLTPYAWQIVLDQSKATTQNYSVVKVKL